MTIDMFELLACMIGTHIAAYFLLSLIVRLTAKARPDATTDRITFTLQCTKCGHRGAKVLTTVGESEVSP